MDPSYDVMHVHISGLITQLMIAVEDGTVHSLHAHAIGRRGYAMYSKRSIIAFEEQAAAGGIVIDVQAINPAGGDDGGVFGGAVKADQRHECGVVITGVIDIKIINDLLQWEDRVIRVPLATDQPFFFGRIAYKHHGALWRILAEIPGGVDHGGAAGGIVAGAIVDTVEFAFLHARVFGDAEMVIMRAQHDKLAAQGRVRTGNKAHHISKLHVHCRRAAVDTVCVEVSPEKLKIAVTTGEVADAGPLEFARNTGGSAVIAGGTDEAAFEGIGCEIDERGDGFAGGVGLFDMGEGLRGGDVGLCV